MTIANCIKLCVRLLGRVSTLCAILFCLITLGIARDKVWPTNVQFKINYFLKIASFSVWPQISLINHASVALGRQREKGRDCQ